MVIEIGIEPMGRWQMGIKQLKDWDYAAGRYGLSSWQIGISQLAYGIKQLADEYGLAGRWELRS